MEMRFHEKLRCVRRSLSRTFRTFTERAKMHSTRNISNGFSKFLNSTTVLTSPVARSIPVLASKHKEPVLKDSRLNYATPTGNACVTTNLLGEFKENLIKSFLCNLLHGRLSCKDKG